MSSRSSSARDVTYHYTVINVDNISKINNLFMNAKITDMFQVPYFYFVQNILNSKDVLTIACQFLFVFVGEGKTRCPKKIYKFDFRWSIRERATALNLAENDMELCMEKQSNIVQKYLVSWVERHSQYRVLSR